MFAFLKNLFHKEPEPSLLLCPHCEEPLTGHDEAACRRRMSRRLFFGVVLAPLAIKAVEPFALIVPREVVTLSPDNMLLTPAWICREALEVLKNNLVFAKRHPYNRKFGDTLNIRRPSRHRLIAA